MAEALAEIEALSTERDEWQRRAESATDTLNFERARQRKQLQLFRAAVEVDMEEGRRGARLMNPVGAELVQAWLDKQERSRRWLARQVDVSDVHLLLVLRGEREPSRDLLERIATVTGVDLDDLLPVVQAVAS